MLIPWIQRAGRIGLGTMGGVAGAAAGGAVGVLVGGIIGGCNGFRGSRARFTAMLHPMENVAGMGGLAAHHGAEKLATKLAGDKVGAIVGKVAGVTVGTVTGAAIGALGAAWAGIDIGARLGSRASRFLLGQAAPLPHGDSNKKTYERGILKHQIPTPDGEVNHSSHHWFYINHGVEMLRNDAAGDARLQRMYDFINSDPDNLLTMHNGAWNMDTFLGGLGEGISLSTFDHFGEPFMIGFKSARWQCRQAYDAASDAWKAGDRKKALYYLGAAMHLPQDLALPQHSVPGLGFVGKMVGHQMMEGYLESHFDQAALSSGGRYFPSIDTPEAFCDYVQNEAAAQYKGAVKEAWQYVGWTKEHGIDPMDPPQQGSGGPEFTLDVYRQAGQRAQAITPGFIEMFFRDMEKQGYPI